MKVKPLHWQRVLIVSGLLLLGLIIFIGIQKKFEGFLFSVEDRDHVKFYTQTESCKLFNTDPDAYFERLTPIDKHAMGIRDTNDAIEKMCKASRSFTPAEQMKILKATEEADQYLRSLQIPFFDGQKCADLKWKLVVTMGRVNEEGMPHTKGDVIYLTDEVVALDHRHLTMTLIHEKVHVYERKYPQLMEEWMKHAGYRRYRRQSDIETARSNPDVDGWTYIDPKGKETVVHYNVQLRNPTESYDSRRHLLTRYAYLPKTILDARYPHGDDPASEHPYEMLAYHIDQTYMKTHR
jgi:hypothetical protein